MQDTPGYGDDLNMMNNIRSMVTFIEAQNKRWLSLELDKQREVRLGCAWHVILGDDTLLHAHLLAGTTPYPREQPHKTD